MKNVKTTFRFFTIYQYEQEEKYLTSMHEKGWSMTGVTFPGFYSFEKTEPEHVVYRLDYNKEGLTHKDEYVQMFADCGWEYIQEFFGYSYFRKKITDEDRNDEIFCDDESRLDMMKRVFRGRLIPLILIFCCMLFPMFIGNTIGTVNSGKAPFIALAFTSLLYLFVFSISAVQFYRCEKRISGYASRVNFKFAGIFSLLGVMALGICLSVWTTTRSVYKVLEKDNGFEIRAEQLNKTVVKEYDFKKGDTIVFNMDSKSGKIHVNVAEKEKESIFSCDFYDSFDGEVEIQNDGHFLIEVTGRRAQSDVEVVIK
ncbi:MAG: DUF2812 domain-containing protein [Oscillospiraceae bacterium]|nr:DUF2812 domain-containing protein [Oscillospiraceae bacterium]